MSGAGRAGGAQGGHRRARGAPRRWPPPVSDSPEPRKSCTLSSPKKDVHEIVDVGLQEDKPGKQGVQISHMLSRFQDTTRGREALKNCPILSWGIKTPRTCSWGSSPRTPSCRSHGCVHRTLFPRTRSPMTSRGARTLTGGGRNSPSEACPCGQESCLRFLSMWTPPPYGHFLAGGQTERCMLRTGGCPHVCEKACVHVYVCPPTVAILAPAMLFKLFLLKARGPVSGQAWSVFLLLP